MKLTLACSIVALLLLHSDLDAQSHTDSASTPRQNVGASTFDPADAHAPPLARIMYPWGAKYSFNGGIGAEYTARPDLSVELNTVLVAHSIKARYFLMEEDVSPFISAGFGLASEEFVHAGVSGYWIEAQVGVERALDRGFMRVQLHYTIDQTEGLGWPQFMPDFTLGYRF